MTHVEAHTATEALTPSTVAPDTSSTVLDPYMAKSEAILPEWVSPLVTAVRDAVIANPGDVDCVAVVRALLMAQAKIELPLQAINAGEEAQLNGLVATERTFIPEQDSFRAVSRALAEELKP